MLMGIYACMYDYYSSALVYIGITVVPLYIYIVCID